VWQADTGVASSYTVIATGTSVSVARTAAIQADRLLRFRRRRQTVRALQKSAYGWCKVFARRSDAPIANTDWADRFAIRQSYAANVDGRPMWPSE